MSKRRRSNRRSSKFNRSSAASVFLDPNSEVLDEEEPFWWNNVTSNSNINLAKYNTTNRTSKYLDSATSLELSDATGAWWKVLENTDSEDPNNLPSIQKNKQPETVPMTTKVTTSDSDTDDSPLPTQKKKIKIRSKLTRSNSNAFLKAFIDTKNSESIEEAAVEEPINDASLSNKLLEESHFSEKQMSSGNITTATDQSHTTHKILKSKPQVFRKRYREKRENAFENVFQSDEDKHNETEKTQMIPANTSGTLIEKNNVSKENLPNESERHMLRMHSSINNSLERSVINQEISKHDDIYIYHERSHASIESGSDHMDEPLQKESSITEKHSNSTVDSIASSKSNNNSRVSHNKNKSPETNDKNETNISVKSKRSEINNSKRSTNVIDQENIIRTTNDIISQSLPISETSRKSVNESTSKRRKINSRNDNTNIEASFLRNNNTISNNVDDVTKNFANYDLTNANKTNDSSKQMSTISSHSNAILTKSATENTNKNNVQLKTKISTLLHEKTNDHAIANLNEVSFSQNNDITQPNELDLGSSTSKQKSIRITNIVANDNYQNVHSMDQLRHNTVDSINYSHQTRINDYFTAPTSKLVSPTKTKQLQSIQHLKATKEDEEIKARLEKKMKAVDKRVDLSKIQGVTQLKRKEIMKKIKKLQNGETKKQPEKAKINKAYLVNGKVYKRPKLPRPQPWVTDRLYRYLWKMMEPKYQLLTRVKSEEFVKRFSDVVSTIIKSKKYENYKEELDNLMHKMARQGIIRTRNDFYDFCYEFLPYDFRVKVVPMIVPGNGRNIPYDPDKLHEPLLEEE